jgi:hypothetical protein
MNSNERMFTAEIDDNILDQFHVDTKSVKPYIPLAEFNAPEDFIWEPYQIKWRRSSDYTYASVEGPFQNISNPTLDDLRKFNWPKPAEVEDPIKWRENAAKVRQSTDRALIIDIPPENLITMFEAAVEFGNY